MTRFQKILIANRGEIACRIQRTCNAMGIATVAVFSEADRDALFVKTADEAVLLGPAPSGESYLAIDKIIDAARRIGADAIHPGYGFLAENAAFAAACRDAGIVFIGPSPEAIELLGSKAASKAKVGEAGVPVVPSFSAHHPAAMKFPVLLKASAGGGGKGMVIVREAAALEEALESVRRVALSAFGDDTILIERYIERPRHIEIQILGDRHGNMVHLFERECSIQRRHQKIIEESPSPALSPELRERMGQAAIEVGRAAGYENAGTVEFILAPGGEFYFLEVNTRLQVEHPVTEMVTGIDLVREQIRVAQGEPLSFSQKDLRQSGAAIECRLYAEDADNDFLPSTGILADWHVPAAEGLRVDTGVELGSEIGIHYDPMLAKIITHAPSRGEAIQKMRRALGRLSSPGVTTNREFLDRVLAHPAFWAGELDTHFLDTHRAELAAPPTSEARLQEAAIAAAVADHLTRRAMAPHVPATGGYRNNRWREVRVGFQVDGRELWVGYVIARDGTLRVSCPAAGLGTAATASSEVATRQVRVLSFDAPKLWLEIDGIRRRYRVVTRQDKRYVLSSGQQVELTEIPLFPDRSATAIEGGCVAPMPGKVVKVLVAVGVRVTAGQTLLILEAMKMEHPVRADREGTLAELLVEEGRQVDSGELLAVVHDVEP